MYYDAAVTHITQAQHFSYFAIFLGNKASSIGNIFRRLCDNRNILGTRRYPSLINLFPFLDDG